MSPSEQLSSELNLLPEKIRHIHCLGICGTGVGALAVLLQQAGYQVSGSDQNVYPPMSDYLAERQIPVKSGYSPENLSPRPDLVIVGNVIRRDNPEAQALARLGIPYLSMPQAINSLFLKEKTSLVVAGTHGKTTTSSLLATMLEKCGCDPGFLIGGIVSYFGRSARLGQGPYFVLEGDEYDTAFFDKGPKFLHYAPRHVILTSIEFDHADIYRDLDHVKSSFSRLIEIIPPEGSLIACLDDPNVRELAASAHCRVIGYGQSPEALWQLEAVEHSAKSIQLTVKHHGRSLAPFCYSMPGRHNALNALAVIALLHELQIDAELIRTHLSTFEGVRRRQEVRGIVHGITVIDDFAHHPTAVRETLAALRAKYPRNRIVAVFEPRTNSSRRSIFQQQYADVFDRADRIFVREPMPLDNLPADEQFSARLLCADLVERGLSAFCAKNTDALLARLTPELQSGDVVAIMSNGGFDNIHQRLLELLKNRKNPPII